MSFWPTHTRRNPYTAAGILRVKCVRCGAPAVHQWQVCADGNNHRPLCLDCDIALNKLVLEWARDPRAREKLSDYAANQRTLRQRIKSAQNR